MDEGQTEAIADAFSYISKLYDPIKTEEINFPPYSVSSVPVVTNEKVKQFLQKIKTNKSTAPGDIPAKILKDYGHFICVPVADLLNKSILSGQ